MMSIKNNISPNSSFFPGIFIVIKWYKMDTIVVDVRPGIPKMQRIIINNYFCCFSDLLTCVRVPTVIELISLYRRKIICSQLLIRVPSLQASVEKSVNKKQNKKRLTQMNFLSNKNNPNLFLLFIVCIYNECGELTD